MQFTAEEVSRLQSYLCHKLGNPDLTVRIRKNAPDSVEVLLKGEFLATIYKDTDEGETSYDLNMAILDIDLARAS
ncbi:MAG: DUF3126 family protein [Spartobacteria bacterium]|nr:DUF3126 family protein [Spartobacteria bacterium]